MAAPGSFDQAQRPLFHNLGGLQQEYSNPDEFQQDVGKLRLAISAIQSRIQQPLMPEGMPPENLEIHQLLYLIDEFCQKMAVVNPQHVTAMYRSLVVYFQHFVRASGIPFGVSI